MDDIEINPPAFPCTPDNFGRSGYLGMSLRDYFAAKAMQGIVSQEARPRTIAKLSEWAYSIADGMLEARGQ